LSGQWTILTDFTNVDAINLTKNSLVIEGNLTQNDNSSIVTSLTLAPLLRVNGSVTLSGTLILVLNVTAPGAYPIISGSNIAGNFTHIVITGVQPSCGYGSSSDGGNFNILINPCSGSGSGTVGTGNNSTGSGAGGLPMAAIAGIAIGGAVLLAVIITLTIWIRWRFFQDRSCLWSGEDEKPGVAGWR